MPTQAVSEILPRRIRGENPELASILDRFGDLLDEIVNLGTHIFSWCNNAVKGRTDEVAPLILSLRHALELLDAVSILIRQSSVEPCKVLLRAFLEVLLGVTYMLQADTDRRALSFMAWYIHHRYKVLEKLDKDLPQGSDFAKRIGLDLPDGHDLLGGRQALLSVLNKPLYKEVEAEYQRLRAAGKKNPSWHSFFGGPATIEQVAAQTGFTNFYEVCYRQWSGMVHGTDLFGGHVTVGPTGVELIGLRNPAEAQQLMSLALGMTLKLFKLYVDTYVPDRAEEYGRWYQREIQALYERITSDPPIIVVE
ncbi:MAG TPA: DUF5677 domain-containing protein [Longimicrobium sp.]|jgi:hypothetical protein|uniref:DUF5677 domain-containing protein n=1 Tax=Longimicrobium sp. TaxID=2029185 RepID=UPI002ED95C8D